MRRVCAVVIINGGGHETTHGVASDSCSCSCFCCGCGGDDGGDDDCHESVMKMKMMKRKEQEEEEGPLRGVQGGQWRGGWR